jgi:hypothetical protein
MKRYFALAFVHPDQVVEAFDTIIFQLEKEFVFLKPDLLDFVCIHEEYLHWRRVLFIY